MILIGDCRETLQTLPDASVHCVVTSPPYWGLRDYNTGTWEGGDAACDHKSNRGAQGQTGQRADRTFTATEVFRDTCGKCGAKRIDAQIGLEPTPQAYVATLVEVFREVRRVMRDDGTLWLNVGDSDSAAPVGRFNGGGFKDSSAKAGTRDLSGHATSGTIDKSKIPGLKPKDLCGVPWRLAFALQEDGWYLRQEIIWNKPNPMPESVRDRCTKAHENVFLMTKRPKYYYDYVAVMEPAIQAGAVIRWKEGSKSVAASTDPKMRTRPTGTREVSTTRNKRSVWTIPSEPFAEAHFAAFPPALAEPCILAGTSAKGVCPVCFAPWRRLTERRQIMRERPNSLTKRTGADGTGNFAPNDTAGVEVVTLGWKPTCKCGAHDVIPATVLDPFLGAGTTGLVAQRLGRNWVGCELSESYAEMARRRIRDDNPLFSAI